MKITKEQYLKLSNPDILQTTEYSNIIVSINHRFKEIIRSISTKFNWWDYNNCYRGGDSGGVGWFEFKDYGPDDYIKFSGEFRVPFPYQIDGIPIRWLWEDFEDEFKKEVEIHRLSVNIEKNKLKLKREAEKIKKAEMKKLITSKLTKEELKFIKFK